MSEGQYSRARRALGTPTPNRNDRQFILDRMRLSMIDLADGYPDSAEPFAYALWQLLHRQGVNEGRTLAASVFGEGGIITWKGEPFEQALGYTTIALTYGELGDFSSMRTAANASLFLLDSFAASDDATDLTVDQMNQRIISEQDDTAPITLESDFALGYLLAGIANLGLEVPRRDEAQELFEKALRSRPELAPVVDTLLTGNANTVLVVDYGLGPRKQRYGPSGALAHFVPIIPGDDRPLEVAVNNSQIATISQACDVNEMAARAVWNNFQDARNAKAILGDVLTTGGLVVAVSSDDDATILAGLAAAAVGMWAKQTAQADLRQYEISPQRSYVVPLNITTPDTTITLFIRDEPGSRLVLHDLAPPLQPDRLQVRLVRLPLTHGEPGPAWANSSGIVYATDQHEGRVQGDELPYILGGSCVRLPSLLTLQHYQSAGRLTGYTVNDLAELYRSEGIALSLDQTDGQMTRHILEGGNSLVAPLAGTTGYQRLFAQFHEPYQPRGELVRQIKEQVHQQDRAINLSSSIAAPMNKQEG